jgi:hypothetical protein
MTWDDFMDLIPEPVPVIIEPYLGDSPNGAIYGQPTTYPRCFVDATRKEAAHKDGELVTSSTYVCGPFTMVCPVRSRVTINTIEYVCSEVETLDAHGLDLPSHVEVQIK